MSCVLYIPIVEGSAQCKRKWLHPSTKLGAVCLKLPLDFCGSSHQFSTQSTDIFEHHQKCENVTRVDNTVITDAAVCTIKLKSMHTLAKFWVKVNFNVVDVYRLAGNDKRNPHSQPWWLEHYVLRVFSCQWARQPYKKKWHPRKKRTFRFWNKHVFWKTWPGHAVDLPTGQPSKTHSQIGQDMVGLEQYQCLGSVNPESRTGTNWKFVERIGDQSDGNEDHRS